jgi:phosphoribosyl 1,2-cyclic phosphodiesterase
MRVFVLGSGSTGNAMLIDAAGTRILVDAGFGPNSAARRLKLIGVDLFPRGVDAIVVTHQHGDHMGRLEPLARALRAPIYFHHGIEARRIRHRYEVRDYDPRSSFRIGALELRAVVAPHDAPQVVLRVASADRSFGIATDLGSITRPVLDLLGSCDAALVEANHCPEMLWSGPYPQRLKQRIGSPLGHLANEQTAHLAARLAGTRLGRLFLGHLSLTNNTPERALAAVRAKAPRLGMEVIPNGVPRALRVVPKRGQLVLPFG